MGLGAFALLAVLSMGEGEEDWPQWRGLHRNGVWNERGLLEQFPPEGLKVRWRAPVGIGYSSPVIALGRVFVTDVELVSVEKRLARERVHCLDAATGRSIWTHGVDVAYPEWAFPPQSKQGPAPTPVVDGGKLYTVGG